MSRTTDGAGSEASPNQPSSTAADRLVTALTSGPIAFVTLVVAAGAAAFLGALATLGSGWMRAQSGAGEAIDLRALSVLGEMSKLYVQIALLGIFLAHAIWAGQRVYHPKKFWISDLLVALASISSARVQALHISSAHSYDGVPAWVLTACFVLAMVLMWRWHMLGCTKLSDEGRLSRTKLRWMPAWFLFGAAVWWFLVGQINALSATSPPTAGYLLFHAFVIAGSLIFALARLNPFASALVIVVGLGSFVRLDKAEPEQWVHVSVPEASAPSTARALLLPNDDLPFDIFDFSLAPRFTCSEAKPRHIETKLPVEPGERKNVILISIDSLRERETRENYRRGPLMPKLQAFEKRAKVFRNAFTSYPATVFSLAGALTGLGASELLMSPGFEPTIFTLAKDAVDTRQIVFGDLAWFKLPVSESLLVQDVAVEHIEGVQKQVSYLLGGFGHLRAKDSSVLAWVHIEEPRRPYRQRPGFKWGKKLRNRYRSEVAYTDSQLGRLLDGLEKGGWFEDSLIIIFADHGEAQGEAGHYGHHRYLNGWTIDIPLIMYYPGVEPERVEHFARITDIAPTVLHWLDLPVRSDIDARSLFEVLADPYDRNAVSEVIALSGAELFERAGIHVEQASDLKAGVVELRESGLKDGSPKVAIVDDAYRLIVNRSRDEEGLFKRKLDLAEKRNLAEGDPDQVEKLRAELREWHLKTAQRIYCRARAAGIPGL